MRRRASIACLAAMLTAAASSAASPAAAKGRGLDRPHAARGGGSGGRQGRAARARAAVYEVLSISSVSDPAGLRASLAKLGPTLAGTGGRMVVDADGPTAVAGTAPDHLSVVVFDDAVSAGRWASSPAFKAVAAEIGKAGTLQASAAGGIADPGAPPAVPVEALGPARGLDRLPAIPKIGDICTGC